MHGPGGRTSYGLHVKQEESQHTEKTGLWRPKKIEKWNHKRGMLHSFWSISVTSRLKLILCHRCMYAVQVALVVSFIDMDSSILNIAFTSCRFFCSPVLRVSLDFCGHPSPWYPPSHKFHNGPNLLRISIRVKRHEKLYLSCQDTFLVGPVG